jgi:hypothetical protein
MLNTRLSGLATIAGDESGADDATNPVHDTEFGFEGDNAPTQVIENNDWTAHQRWQLRAFSEQLMHLANLKDDQKCAATEMILDDWLANGFNPVVFCRYIKTADYVGELLTPVVKRNIPTLIYR